ncbi:hypothetical protein D3C74_460660 [compost metagenome]
MNVLTIAYGYCRSCPDLFQIVKMAGEIRFAEINFMNMTASDPDCLPSDSCEAMVMPIRAFFGKFRTAFKFMHMPLSPFRICCLSL